VLRKAVIPAAGLGTRLLSVTKEQPKEMLPVFARAKNGDLCLKPIVQLVFEQLHQVGFREFCFVVGRGKRAIEDHFTPDFSFVSMLPVRGWLVRRGSGIILQDGGRVHRVLGEPASAPKVWGCGVEG
jgi:UTP--glucose-1-phosphate uridylyltransferase